MTYPGVGWPDRKLGQAGGGELCEREVAVDSVVDFTFPDSGVNTHGLGVQLQRLLG